MIRLAIAGILALATVFTFTAGSYGADGNPWKECHQVLVDDRKEMLYFIPRKKKPGFVVSLNELWIYQCKAVLPPRSSR